ncbi:serine protease 1-like isoform X2 [Penaeus chinensis]|uniref:serine protease 1-like isoform X2 n=1 Tax=Penaeus chinensis TaxID=139456 RepID=UPI001FB5E4E1|nr:serine protease 1-like isoform X2 [Penaeus chinensis]
MVLLFAVLCGCAVALEPAFKFDWTPPLEVIPHGPPRGVLVSDQFVLTAAHCVTKSRAKYSVLLGGHDLTGREESHQIIDVEKVFIHPNYSFEKSVSSDIAVLKLKTKIKMNSKVSPIHLPKDNVYTGMPLVLTGWGATKTGVQSFSVLQVMSTSAIGLNHCKQAFPWLDSSMFCVYVPESSSTVCNGDSGGPAAYNNSVMGIVSFAAKGCLPEYPQGFTNVFAAKNWIENVMEGSERSASGPSLPIPCTLLVLFLVLVLVYPFL